jgi:hypothetical protein
VGVSPAREAFERGFALAIRRWHAGEKTEELCSLFPAQAAHDRGVRAACELILGWDSVAESDARKAGFSYDGARHFVAEQKKDLDRKHEA